MDQNFNNDQNNFNNQSINNQNFNQGMGVNPQSVNQMNIQSMNNGFQQQNVQQPVQPQPMPQQPVQNNYNMNTQPTNTPKKKSNMGLIIGIVVAVVVVIGVIVLLSSSRGNNNYNNSNGQKSSGNEVNVGAQKIKYFKDYSEEKSAVNEFGLFKVNNEYVYKGGDNYTEIDNSGNTSAKYEQGYLNNIVKFNNNYWRIVKINVDGTIKLIYFGTLEDGKIMNKLDLQIKYFNDGATEFTYEKSNLREYLNSTVLNNTSLIPANYKDYLVKSKWDISKYNIYIKEAVSTEISNYEDYIGVISIQEHKDATYCYWITTGTGYKSKLCDNYIDNILNTATNTKQLKTNTSNIVVDNGTFRGVAKIERANGEFVTNTEYEVYRQLDNNVLPVITLKSDIKFDGSGTVSNPYIIK